ncbi:cytochrome P450 [Mycena crocata]|nr:cytochrome P450 [Mycena crocata]
MSLPPGIVYLLKRVPRLFVPPLAVYCARLAAERFFDVIVPRWLTVVACVLSGPAALTAIVQYRDYVVRRDAAAAGAIVCPTVPGSIGGLNLLRATTKDTYPGEPLAIFARDLGYTFSTRLFFQTRILTFDPETFKSILATGAKGFEKGEEFRKIMYPLLGSGLFNADGDMWKFHRGMTRPFFHRERVSDFDTFDQHAEKAMGAITARLREGHPLDIADVILRYTLDDATSFLFHHDLHSLSAGLPYPYYVSDSIAHATAEHPSNIFCEAFHEVQSVSASRNRFGEHWPLAEFWENKLDKPLGIVRAFLDPILKDAIENRREMEKAGMGEEKKNDVGDREVQEGESLLDHLVTYTQDQNILRDEIMNVTAAGRDTTAGLITFVMYMLAEHPDVLKKLRGEILRVVGPNRRPTFEDFKELKYLRAVLNETLRLYPSVPFNPRTALQPTVLRTKDGPPIYVPKGAKILVSQFVLHRRADLWGPDVLVFDPERFLDERLHKYLVPNPFIFMPFNAGPRICLGQQFAYHEASFFVVRFLQRFSTIALAPEAQPPSTLPPAAWKTDDKIGWTAHEKIRPRSHFTIYVEGGLWVRMGEAGAEEGL